MVPTTFRGLAAPFLNTGHLVLAGGKEDKRDEMIVLRRIVGIDDAGSVAVIPTASDYPHERLEKYQRAFTELGVREVSAVDVRSRADAGRTDYVEMVRRADVVFFTGGDQVKLVHALRDTRLLNEVWNRFSAGATIAGTSAGAAVASDPMIFDGDGAGLNKGAVRHAPGFGFLDGITVDTHFVARGRISRLTQFLCTDHTRRGLGLGENTAVLIQPGGLCEVIGTGVVTVLETGDSHHSNYDRIAEDELVTGEGFRLGFLAAGTVFNLRSWRIARFPEHHDHRPWPEKEELYEGLRNE